MAECFGMDVRGVRYPGIISNVTPPGGGTTDYAVEIFYAAIREKRYTCFVRPDTVLPMMYMPDCIKGTIDLMEADLARPPLPAEQQGEREESGPGEPVERAPRTGSRGIPHRSPLRGARG